jgi:hypothetical protein
MQYFDTLPKMIKTDNNGISLIMTNIMARASIIPDILKNPLVYYEYDIQEGDTPETIAYKYYGDSYRYWIVLLANQILDPQWGWPMNNDVFESYLLNKYGSNFPIHSAIHHYEEIITQYDSGTLTSTVNTTIISEDTYNNLITSTKSYSLPTGTVTITISKNDVNYYDYELQQNEKNRSIQLLNANYVGELESQFESLMA